MRFGTARPPSLPSRSPPPTSARGSSVPPPHRWGTPWSMTALPLRHGIRSPRPRTLAPPRLQGPGGSGWMHSEEHENHSLGLWAPCAPELRSAPIIARLAVALLSPVQMTESTAQTGLSFLLNGSKVALDSCEPARTLLEYLREDARLTGAKLGCGEVRLRPIARGVGPVPYQWALCGRAAGRVRRLHRDVHQYQPRHRPRRAPRHQCLPRPAGLRRRHTYHNC